MAAVGFDVELGRRREWRDEQRCGIDERVVQGREDQGRDLDAGEVGEARAALVVLGSGGEAGDGRGEAVVEVAQGREGADGRGRVQAGAGEQGDLAAQAGDEAELVEAVEAAVGAVGGGGEVDGWVDGEHGLAGDGRKRERASRREGGRRRDGSARGSRRRCARIGGKWSARG